MSWADDQLAKEGKQRDEQSIEHQMNLRLEKKKDECGPLLFGQVRRAIKEEGDKYNISKGGSGLKLSDDSSALSSSANFTDLTSQIPSFSVQRKDGLFSPIEVSYLPASHALWWKCGGTSGSFLVTLDSQGQCQLEESDGTPISPTKVAELLLSRLMREHKPSGSPWR